MSETEIVERRRPARTVLVAAAVAVAAMAAVVVPRLVADADKPNKPAGASEPDKSTDRRGPVADNMAGDPPPQEAAPGSGSFDPLRRVIQVGQVDGLNMAEYVTARYWQTLSLEDTQHTLAVEVRAYPPRHAGMFFAPQGRVEPTSGQSTESVGKAAARWLPDGQRHFQYEAVRLAWQSADGGWVFVTAASTDEEGRRPKVPADQLRQLARRVATVTTVKADGPAVTMPFTVPTPAGLRLATTQLLRGTQANGRPILRATLNFAARDDQQNPGIGQRENLSGRSVTAALASPDEKPGSAKQQVDGHPASVRDEGATIYDVADGFAVEVAGPLELARSVRFVPSPRNETNWTPNPLR